MTKYLRTIILPVVGFALPRKRRIRVLSDQLAELLPSGASVLDIGGGSGNISKAVQARVANITIRALDVIARPDRVFPVELYDGVVLPSENRSYDYVTLVDVLHHTSDPMALLRESFRVAKTAVIVKDHNCNSWFARRVMTFTDWFANRFYGVEVLFNFWNTEQWNHAWRELNTSPDVYRIDFGLYPKWKRIIFAKDMDFIAQLPVR